MQNMIPAVEGLLPEPHNRKLLTLLFWLAEWHALAKLRMHTEPTLDHLHQSTATIGQELRSLKAWTQAFKTVELPGESNAQDRRRRRGKTAAKNIPRPAPLHKGITAQDHNVHSTATNAKSSSTIAPKESETLPHLCPGTSSTAAGEEPSNPAPPASSKPKVKLFSLLTYKLHALGDYVRAIQLHGTTDSYSTQIVGPSFFLRKEEANDSCRGSLHTV
jgi:hypothetical protein